MKSIKRVGVGSVALYVGTAGAVVGVLIGVTITLLMSMWGWTSPVASGWEILFRGTFWTVLVWPAWLFVTGYIAGAVWGWIYNVAADIMGGIKIDLE